MRFNLLTVILFISWLLVGTAYSDEKTKPALILTAPKKPKLITKLPFEPFCGEILTAIPPNAQLVKKFAEQTAIQSFSYDYEKATEQLDELESCYSIAGWQSFKRALSVSGNLRAAVDEKLFVSAHVIGEIELVDSNHFAPSWKVLVPLKVRYENTSYYLEHKLNVKLVIGIEDKKMVTEQFIATPDAAPHSYEKPLVSPMTPNKHFN